MAKANKIEARTKRFVSEYQKLKKAGKLPSHEALMAILKVKSKSSISEILAERQNIQPESWSAFRTHFGISEGDAKSETSELTVEEAIRREREAVDRERKALQDDKVFLQDLIKTNLTLVLGTARTISARQIAAGKVILGSLERLEGVDPETLQKEVDKEIGQIEREAYTHGSEAPART